ncbi:hypothetical protein STXM2123_2225 [Streptomyces sp. F-3]|nr:hypothetical protein STXM2123_2225 [Streptomyces sp. F-3]
MRKGGRGSEVTESPAYGWLTRVTVTGGPELTPTSTAKLKLLGPASRGGVATASR